MPPIAAVARSLVLVVALLTSAVSTLPAQATGAITGIVRRGGQSGVPTGPAAGAEVRLSAVDPATESAAVSPSERTDDSGSFAFRGLGAGTYRLSVRLVGYVSTVVDVSLAEGGVSQPTIVLVPLSPELERVLTTANRSRVANMLELRGFTGRRMEGWGHFMAPEQLARSGATSLLSELKPWLRGCMIMYVDGVPASVPRSLQTRDVAGVEIYSRNLQAPAGYQSARGDCGSVLIWLAPPGADDGSP
jgi:hypothetical protein